MPLGAPKKTVLIVDDDRIFCESVKDFLSSDSVEVIPVHTAADGLAVCSGKKIDVALLDQRLPDAEGHTLCPSILKYHEQTKIIFSTAYPSFDNAVEAIRAGAYDYLSKPFELEELRLAVNQAFRTLDLEKVEQFQNYKRDKEKEESNLIGSRGGLAEVRRLVELAASVDAPVLITGETGSGKNVAAKCIHYSSPASGAPFVGINCAAIPENLIEAELFGYEKGAFTGATAARKGIFEMAEGGTLFLDEIGEMPLHLQAKLLGVLDDSRIKRLGGDSIRQVNVRIIAATSVDLENAIPRKAFREDLFYRLTVIKIHIPPLRERREDMPELCRYLISKIAGGRTIRVSEDEIGRLMEYDWPGNVRELRNVLERATILQKGPDILPSELLYRTAGARRDIAGAVRKTGEKDEAPTLDDVEKDYIRKTLTKFSGNYTRAARAMGISLSTLKRKIKRYDLTSSK